MAKKRSVKNKSPEIKTSIFDKIIFIISGLSTLTVFILDWCTDVLTLDLKWQIILGLITVLSGFFTIIAFCFDKKFKNLEKRIVTTEKSITGSQKNSLEKTRVEFENKLSYLHDLYSYQASENIDFKEYAQKEVEKLILKLNSLCSNGESEILEEESYYDKLHQLADKIVEDQSRYNLLDESTKQTLSNKPIVWALTCFNEEEWGEEIKSEDEWSDRLEELTAKHGIIVERICILSDDIQNFIKIEDREELNRVLSNNKHIKSFIGFLFRYYKAHIIEKYRKSTIHYAFFEQNTSDALLDTRGFFGICLSNGEKHIVKGDCDLTNGVSTAKIVFNCNRLYDEFESKKQRRKRLESYLNGNASTVFKEFLKSKNVIIGS